MRFRGIWLTDRHLALEDIGIAERVLLPCIQFHAENEQGECFATNEYLGRIMAVRPREITRGVRALVAAGYLTMTVKGKRDGKGGQVRYLTPTAKCPPTMLRQTGSSPNGTYGLNELQPSDAGSSQDGTYDRDRQEPPRQGYGPNGTEGYGPNELVAQMGHMAEMGPLNKDSTYRESFPESESKNIESSDDAATRVRGAAAPNINAWDADPAGIERGGTPPACAHAREGQGSPEFERAVALLLCPVAEGGAGGDSDAMARRMVNARGPDQIAFWISEAKRKGARKPFPWIYAAINRGDEPPESFIRWQKQQYLAATTGGPLGDLFPPSNRSRSHPDAPEPPPPRREVRPRQMDDIERQRLEMLEDRKRDAERRAQPGSGP